MSPEVALRVILRRHTTSVAYMRRRTPVGKENNWIQTIPGKGWFAYFRIYGPQGLAFDGSWRPGDFEEMK